MGHALGGAYVRHEQDLGGLKRNLDGPKGARGVCEQREWDEMRRRTPDAYTLIHSGIPIEPEAERLAREPAGPAAVKVAIHNRL